MEQVSHGNCFRILPSLQPSRSSAHGTQYRVWPQGLKNVSIVLSMQALQWCSSSSCPDSVNAWMLPTFRASRLASSFASSILSRSIFCYIAFTWVSFSEEWCVMLDSISCLRFSRVTRRKVMSSLSYSDSLTCLFISCSWFSVARSTILRLFSLRSASATSL